MSNKHPGEILQAQFLLYSFEGKNEFRYFPFASYRLIQLPYSGLSEEILVKPLARIDPPDVIRTSEIWLCVPVSRRESLKPRSRLKIFIPFSKYVNCEQVIEEIELCRSRETEFTGTVSRSAQRTYQVARLFIDEYSPPYWVQKIYPGRTINAESPATVDAQPFRFQPDVFG